MPEILQTLFFRTRCIYQSLTVDVRFQDCLPVVEVQLQISVVDVVRGGKQQTVVPSLEANRDVVGVRRHHRLDADVSQRLAVVRQYWRHCAHTHAMQ